MANVQRIQLGPNNTPIQQDRSAHGRWRYAYQRAGAPLNAEKPVPATLSIIQDAERLVFAATDGPAAFVLADALTEYLWTRETADDDWPQNLRDWLADTERWQRAPAGLTGFVCGRLERGLPGGRIHLAWLGMNGVRLLDRSGDWLTLDRILVTDEGWTPAHGPEPVGMALHAYRGSIFGLERLVVYTESAASLSADLADMSRSDLQQALEDWSEEATRDLVVFDLRLAAVTTEPSSVILSYRWIRPDLCELAWQSTPGATGYRIEEGSTPAFEDATLLAELTDARQIRYRFSPPASGAYFYRVIPLNQGAVGTPSNPVSVTPLPLAPPILEPVQWAHDGGYHLTWTPVVQASSYEVQSAPNHDFDEAECQIIYRGDIAEAYLPPDLAPRQHYRVRALNALYAPHNPSPWSNAQRAPSQLATPMFSNVTQRRIRWDEVPGARQYAVHVTAAGQDEDHQGETFYTAETVVPVADQPAVYRVRALRHPEDQRTASEWSEPVTISPARFGGAQAAPSLRVFLPLVLGAAMVALVVGMALGWGGLEYFQERNATATRTAVPRSEIQATTQVALANNSNATLAWQVSATSLAAFYAQETTTRIPTNTPSLTPNFTATLARAVSRAQTMSALVSTTTPRPTFTPNMTGTFAVVLAEAQTATALPFTQTATAWTLTPTATIPDMTGTFVAALAEAQTTTALPFTQTAAAWTWTPTATRPNVTGTFVAALAEAQGQTAEAMTQTAAAWTWTPTATIPDMTGTFVVALAEAQSETAEAITQTAAAWTPTPSATQPDLTATYAAIVSEVESTIAAAQTADAAAWTPTPDLKGTLSVEFDATLSALATQTMRDVRGTALAHITQTATGPITGGDGTPPGGEDEPQPIEFGDEVEGTLPGDVPAVWVFEGAEGGSVTIIVSGPAGTSLTVTVLDPSGEIAATATSEDGEPNIVLPGTLAANGTYQIQIAGPAGTPYTLRLSDAAQTFTPRPDVKSGLFAKPAFQEPNRLVNGSLERPYYGTTSGTRTAPNGWNLWVGAGAPEAFPHTDKVQVIDGEVSWNIKQGYVAFTAAGYQRVSGLEAGKTVTFRAYAWLYTCNDTEYSCIIPDYPYRASDTSAGASVKVGIDPNGGTDPTSASVVWSTVAAPYDSWADLSVAADPVGDAVTVFMYVSQTRGLAMNNVYWDNASLTGGGIPSSSGGGGAAIATPTPVSVPFVVPQGVKPDGSIVHVVQAQDTLSSIAYAYAEYGVTLESIAELNEGIRPNTRWLTIGQQIIILPPGSVDPTTGRLLGPGQTVPPTADGESTPVPSPTPVSGDVQPPAPAVPAGVVPGPTLTLSTETINADLPIELAGASGNYFVTSPQITFEGESLVAQMNILSVPGDMASNKALTLEAQVDTDLGRVTLAKQRAVFTADSAPYTDPITDELLDTIEQHINTLLIRAYFEAGQTLDQRFVISNLVVAPEGLTLDLGLVQAAPPAGEPTPTPEPTAEGEPIDTTTQPLGGDTGDSGQPLGGDTGAEGQPVEATPDTTTETTTEPVEVNVTPGALPDPVVIFGADTGASFETGGEIDEVGSTAMRSLFQAKLLWVNLTVPFRLGDQPGAQQSLVESIQANNQKLLLTVVGDPAELESTDRAQYIQQYAQYVGGLAALGVDGIEIWRDMNVAEQWPATLGADVYVELLAYSHNAIKLANDTTLVISGAPLPIQQTSEDDPVITDAIIYDEMAAAGAARYMDCIGAQYLQGAMPPAASGGDPRGDSAIYFLSTMTDRAWNAFGGTEPVCYTRLGYLSLEGYPATPVGYEWAQGITVARQTEWLIGAILLSQEASDKVRLLIIYHASVPSLDDAVEVAGYSIVRPDGTCPACEALAGLTPAG